MKGSNLIRSIAWPLPVGVGSPAGPADGLDQSVFLMELALDRRPRQFNQVDYADWPLYFVSGAAHCIISAIDWPSGGHEVGARLHWWCLVYIYILLLVFPAP